MASEARLRNYVLLHVVFRRKLLRSLLLLLLVVSGAFFTILAHDFVTLHRDGAERDGIRHIPKNNCKLISLKPVALMDSSLLRLRSKTPANATSSFDSVGLPQLKDCKVWIALDLEHITGPFDPWHSW